MYEIKLKIREESDLYSPFDESFCTLNADVIDYLNKQYAKKGMDREIALRIKSDTPIDRERVRKAFRELIREQELHNEKQKRINLLKQLWLFSVGIVFVAAAIFLGGKLDSMLFELISIVGSFAIWEAANIWIVENPKARLRKIMLGRLKATKIVME